MSNATPAKSMAPGSPVLSGATTPSAHAAGKQRATGAFTIAQFLEDSNALLEKIKHTAANVTTCQNQIDQVFDRAGSLLEALSTDAKALDKVKLQEAGAAIEETLKDLHKHVLRFAIYGRPKAFVTRAEISAYFETFNIQVDSVLKMFAVAKHPDVEDWEGEYYQSKLEDEAASHEQLWEILNNESDLKTVMELGEDALDGLKIACASAVEDPHTAPDRKKMFENAGGNLEHCSLGDPGLLQPRLLLNEPPTPIANTRLAAPSGLARASSSGSQNIRPTSSTPTKTPKAPVETAAARAKREEAERERAQGAEEEPTLPRWEPRRPPPGRGPGSMDGTTEAARNLSALAMDDPNAPPGGGYEAQTGVPEDLPPSYS